MPDTLVKTRAAVCLLLAIVSCAGYGQRKSSDEEANTRAVEGIVTDVSGHPVAKAVVQLEDTKTLQIRSYITDSDGSYHFAGLSTNVEYQLRADHDGVSSSRKTLDVFNTKKVAKINLKLKK